MLKDKYPSKYLSDAVEQFAKLPGIGERTALRLALFLLRLKKEEALSFGTIINDFIENIQFCQTCHNISDSKTCDICASKNRDKSIICVVENVKDVMAIEQTHQYKGLFHVLGGIISPMEGISPIDLEIGSLIKRVKVGSVKEIILALSATMEGDTTNFYLYKKLKDFNIKLSVIARGVSFGDELEYTDEVTLGRSIINRTPFESK
ncbi:MAG: recombination protein RecR [Bacteroidales bacterium]|nr:recombination protein RecR [Bacteroidales bacterium]